MELRHLRCFVAPRLTAGWGSAWNHRRHFGEELVLFDIVLSGSNQTKAEFYVWIVGVTDLAFTEKAFVGLVPELQIGSTERLNVVGEIDCMRPCVGIVRRS